MLADPFGQGVSLLNRGSSPTASAPRAEHAPSRQIVEPGVCPIALTGLSFGRTRDYLTNGGQSVISDTSPADAPLDLAVEGLRLPRDLNRGSVLTAAFVTQCKPPKLQVSLACADAGVGSVFISARSGGSARVADTLVQFNTNGLATLEVPVLNLRLDRVTTLSEQWTWEWHVKEGTKGGTLQFGYAGQTVEALPVRVYVTAGRAINSAPRDSFYAIACAEAGASTLAEVEQSIWRRFIAFNQGGCVTNASGKRLTFWAQSLPGPEQPAYLSRDAQALVTRGDSSCHGWADLLREVFAIHGIVSKIRAVQPKLSRVMSKYRVPSFPLPDGQGGMTVIRTVGILVKPYRWEKPDAANFSHFSGPDNVIQPGGFTHRVNNPADTAAALWPQTDADCLGRQGQTAPGVTGNAFGLFGNHAVVLVKDTNGTERWYDPSFGFGPHPSLSSYERELLGKGEQNPGGLFAIIGCKLLRQTNPQTGQSEVVAPQGPILGAVPAPDFDVLEAVDPA